LTAAEPFFRIESSFKSEAAADGGDSDLPHIVHGRIGTMRITLSNRPLLVQWERKLRQFFQRKFRV
jgi:putative peptide zinc metalloprotease protein